MSPKKMNRTWRSKFLIGGVVVVIGFFLWSRLRTTPPPDDGDLYTLRTEIAQALGQADLLLQAERSRLTSLREKLEDLDDEQSATQRKLQEVQDSLDHQCITLSRYAELLESPHGVKLPNGCIIPTKTVCRQAAFKKMQFDLASTQADLLSSRIQRVSVARRLLTASLDARTTALAEVASLREQLRAQQTLIANLDTTDTLTPQPAAIPLPTKTELRRTLNRIVERMDEQLLILETDLEFDAMQNAYGCEVPTFEAGSTLPASATP